MFFLLYRHTNDGVFDDCSKISDNFPKIYEDSSKLVRKSNEHCRTFSEIFRRLPKTTEDRRRLSRKTQRYKLRDKLHISVIIDIFTSEEWKIYHPSLGCGSVRILRVVYFPVKHACLCNKRCYFQLNKDRLHIMA